MKLDFKTRDRLKHIQFDLLPHPQISVDDLPLFPILLLEPKSKPNVDARQILETPYTPQMLCRPLNRKIGNENDDTMSTITQW